MNVADNAKAACWGACPTVPISWPIAIGIVVVPDLDRNDVAPNSPNDTAIDNPVARHSADFIMGISTEMKARRGDAPRTVAL